MKSKEQDHRSRITLMLIRKALMELLRQKPIQAISIKELCESAGINRGTFYAHYTDMYDLLPIQAISIKELCESAGINRDFLRSLYRYV